MGRYRHVPLPEEPQQPRNARRDGWATWGPSPSPAQRERDRKAGRKAVICIAIMSVALIWGGPLMLLLVLIPLGMSSYGPFKVFGQVNRYGRWDYGRGRPVATQEERRDPLHPYDEV